MSENPIYQANRTIAKMEKEIAALREENEKLRKNGLDATIYAGEISDMSLRQYYAGAALQGILANPNSLKNPVFSSVESAVLHADRLIEELNKQPGTILPDVEKFHEHIRGLK